MDDLTLSAALLSGFLHAAWNAAVKNSADPTAAMAVQIIAAGALCAPLLLIMPLPPWEAVSWLAGAVALNILAMLALLRGYGLGEFGVVYPLARATSSLLAPLWALLVLGERLTLFAVTGVVLVSVGVALLASSDRANRPAAAFWAVLAGALLAAYAICDAQGARLSPSALGYGSLMTVLNAVIFGSLFWLKRGRAFLAGVKGHLAVGSAAAVASTTSYLLIIWVWTRVPVALGTALRDSSVVFGALIAVVALKERISVRWVCAIVLVTLGAVVLRLA